jgi:FAD/FMN-containing dehydrogenase
MFPLDRSIHRDESHSIRAGTRDGWNAGDVDSDTFSQADWIQHYGPIWESFRDAKNRFDPHNVLTPGQGIFPSAVGERRV